jgi:hypothetical protein
MHPRLAVAVDVLNDLTFHDVEMDFLDGKMVLLKFGHD